MIQIRVIEASRLLLIVAALALCIALCALLWGAFGADPQTPARGAATVGTDAAALAAASVPVSASNASPSNASPSNASPSNASASNASASNASASNTPAAHVPAFTARVVAPAPSAAPAARVLIYHTHTCEAYAQTPDDPYVETQRWRTDDPSHSVVRVGAYLADCLRDLNISVTHDTTNHEPPDLATAYARSLATVNRHGASNFDLVIDLHRDAYSEANQDVRAASVGGSAIAQIMVLIGRGDGYAEKPDIARNQAFAEMLTLRLNERAEGACRPVLVKAGRYNQHTAAPALLIEVGHNQNTLKEALAAMPYLAEAVARVLAA